MKDPAVLKIQDTKVLRKSYSDRQFSKCIFFIGGEATKAPFFTYRINVMY